MPQLKHTLKAKAVLCPGLKVTFRNEASGEKEEWFYTGDLGAYLVEELDKHERIRNPEAYLFTIASHVLAQHGLQARERERECVDIAHPAADADLAIETDHAQRIDLQRRARIKACRQVPAEEGRVVPPPPQHVPFEARDGAAHAGRGGQQRVANRP